MQPNLPILWSSSEAPDLPYLLLKLSKEAPWRRGRNISYTSIAQPRWDPQQRAHARVRRVCCGLEEAAGGKAGSYRPFLS